MIILYLLCMHNKQLVMLSLAVFSCTRDAMWPLPTPPYHTTYCVTRHTQTQCTGVEPAPGEPAPQGHCPGAVWRTGGAARVRVHFSTTVAGRGQLCHTGDGAAAAQRFPPHEGVQFRNSSGNIVAGVVYFHFVGHRSTVVWDVASTAVLLVVCFWRSVFGHYSSWWSNFDVRHYLSPVMSRCVLSAMAALLQGSNLLVEGTSCVQYRDNAIAFALAMHCAAVPCLPPQLLLILKPC